MAAYDGLTLPQHRRSGRWIAAWGGRAPGLAVWRAVLGGCHPLDRTGSGFAAGGLLAGTEAGPRS